MNLRKTIDTIVDLSTKNIAIIFGGCSPEYEVSLQSAYAIIKHIDKKRYIPVLIGITRQGEWLLFDGDIEKIPTDTWHNTVDCVSVAVSPNQSEHCLLKITENGIEKISIYAVFPVLHGKNGEDGTVQGMFALAGIPLVGCGVLSSALCMDKDRAHRLISTIGINVPHSYVLEKNMDAGVAISYAEELGYPLLVKPVNAGSSFGITKVSDRNELPAAIKLAFLYDDKIIMEENITGIEVGCAIVGNDQLTVGEIDEIELSDGFFNYSEKYTLKTSAIHVPARIDDITKQEIKQTAKKIYTALNCQGFARVDMFLSSSGEIIFNEVNTIPGFTEHSRFPNMLKAIEISFEQMITMVIELAGHK